MIEFLKIEINGKEYKTEGLPSVGQFIDVESLKVLLSSGTYDKLSIGNTTNARLAADLVAAEAYITKFFPKYLKTLDSPFSDLAIKDVVNVVKAYKEQLLPQINELTEALSDLSVDE